MKEVYVNFYFQNSSIRLSNRKRLRAFIKALFEKEGKKLQTLNCIFCSDKYLLKINQRYLLHDFYTDILTFDLSESEEIKAEIYISLDRIRENAKLFNTSMYIELLRILFHGVLHLCGYNDKSRGEKKTMDLKEEFYLDKWKRNS